MQPGQRETGIARQESGVERPPTFDPEHRVVAVTGAHGFLGAEIIKRMERDRRYRKVLAVDIRRPNVPLTKTQFHRVDLTLPNADSEVARILQQEQADTLVHLAFLSRPTHDTAWAHELEAVGTMHVLNACAACRIHKVVMWSVTALYGPSPVHPNFLTEEHQPRGIPGSRFLRDRLEAERLAQQFREECTGSVMTILRTASILGQRVRNYVADYLGLPAVPILMGYDPLVQLLHEDDAVAAFKHCLDSDYEGVYNVAGDGVLPLSTVLALAGRVSVPVPHFLAEPAAKLLWMSQVLGVPPVYLDFLRYLCIVDTRKMREEMCFLPRHDIRQTVAAFVAETGSAEHTSPGQRELVGEDR